MNPNSFLSVFNRQKNKAPRAKARTEKGRDYPDRFDVPEDKAPWNKKLSGYKPEYYVAPVVIKNDETKKPEDYEGKDYWAHPEDISLVAKEDIQSHEPLQFDAEGFPLNPRGRTGIKGRGELGKWGANFAADPIITADDPVTGEKRLLLIRRKDTGEWALPGGMRDKEEKLLSATASRELKEEAGISVDMSLAEKVYEGYVDDPRNTDNAWMETSAYHLHLTPEQSAQALEAGDDASDARWVPVSELLSQSLYASHKDLIKKALKLS